MAAGQTDMYLMLDEKLNANLFFLQRHQQKPLFCYSASDYSYLGQTLNPRTLIFISKFEVLAGMYPVAQVREPYSVVQYLAERCDLPASLGIRLSEDEDAWSAYLICDG